MYFAGCDSWLPEKIVLTSPSNRIYEVTSPSSSTRTRHQECSYKGVGHPGRVAADRVPVLTQFRHDQSGAHPSRDWVGHQFADFRIQRPNGSPGVGHKGADTAVDDGEDDAAATYGILTGVARSLPTWLEWTGRFQSLAKHPVLDEGLRGKLGMAGYSPALLGEVSATTGFIRRNGSNYRAAVLFPWACNYQGGGNNNRPTTTVTAVAASPFASKNAPLTAALESAPGLGNWPDVTWFEAALQPGWPDANWFAKENLFQARPGDALGSQVFALADADWEQQLEATQADPGTWPAAAPTAAGEVALPLPTPPQRKQRQYREFTGPPAHAVNGNDALFACQHAPDKPDISSTLHRTAPEFTLAEYTAQVPPVPSDPSQFLPFYAGSLMATDVDPGGAWPSLPADPLTADQLSFYRDYDRSSGGGARGKGWDATAKDMVFELGDAPAWENKDYDAPDPLTEDQLVFYRDYDTPTGGGCRGAEWGIDRSRGGGQLLEEFDLEMPQEGYWKLLGPDPLTDAQLAYYDNYHTENGFGIRGVEWSKKKPEFDTSGVGPESETFTKPPRPRGEVGPPRWASAWETVEAHSESSCKHCKKQQQQRHKREQRGFARSAHTHNRARTAPPKYGASSPFACPKAPSTVGLLYALHVKIILRLRSTNALAAVLFLLCRDCDQLLAGPGSGSAFGNWPSGWGACHPPRAQLRCPHFRHLCPMFPMLPMVWLFPVGMQQRLCNAGSGRGACHPPRLMLCTAWHGN